MKRRSRSAALERQAKEAGGVEPVHSRPSVAALAEVRRHTFLARDADEHRDEGVIAVTMHRWRQAYHGRAHAACCQRERCTFRNHPN
ncbi:MAG TPA: hypothetical protein VMS04_06245 [Vicinamibacterales bacterium]|nr:hypothetical protein [Vicinamibacterales bacterium]